MKNNMILLNVYILVSLFQLKMIPITLTKASPNIPKGPDAGKIIWNAMAYPKRTQMYTATKFKTVLKTLPSI